MQSYLMQFLSQLIRKLKFIDFVDSSTVYNPNKCLKILMFNKSQVEGYNKKDN